MSQSIPRHSGTDGLLSKKIEGSPFYRIKEHLQFTGWMQYLPNAMLALMFFLLAGVGRWVGLAQVFLFWFPLWIGVGLLCILTFDLITVKWGLHPAEKIPEPNTRLDAFDLMRSRRSCRSFQSRALTDAHRKELLEAASRFSRPDHLLGDVPIRFEYIAAPLTVWPVVGAREFLVAITPKTYNRMAVIDVGRSLQKVVLHATRMGLGTCWIGPGADHHSIAGHLGDRFAPEKDHIICVCAVGYPSWFKPTFLRVMHVIGANRKSLSELFFAAPDFQAPLDVKAAPFNSYGRCYEVCQWSPSSFNSQTTRCAAVMSQHNGTQRLMRFDFAASTESRYYAPVAEGIWCANWETGCEALGLRGKFCTLSPEQRKVSAPPETPRVDISWVIEENEAHAAQAL